MKTILVTGANGFVGSHILEALGSRDQVRVIAACRDPKRLLKSYTGEVRVGDLRDPEFSRPVLEGVDVVCHAAAWTAAWNHTRQSEVLFLKPTIDLIENAAAANLKRFIFLSSSSVAAPYASADAMAPANEAYLSLWPHMRNVARIESRMRALGGGACEMTSLRVGLFAGRRYGIGLLSLLVPRLKTHLVPWVNGGRTTLPIIAGEDIGESFALAATAQALAGYQGMNIVGPENPTVKDVFGFLSDEYSLPKPHFGVPFPLAYMFARTMELIDPIVPWEPLVTRSIIHLLEETGATNALAEKLIGYRPRIAWRDALRMQMEEMAERQTRAMRMVRPLPPTI